MIGKKTSPAIFAALLAALVLAVYWRTGSFDFIKLDDPANIVNNRLVTSGISPGSVRDAFFSSYEGIWFIIPLTWISYMAEVSISGMDPGSFHTTNTILFCANVLLLFLFLRSATGSTWRSFFAAALWAMHPLRVESVAWISERKDVLSGLFFLLSLWSYLLYTRSRKVGWHVALMLCALLGMLSKPILTVLPVGLLLIDFWPLRRFPQGEGGWYAGENLGKIKELLLEKIPVTALSLVWIAVTVYTQIISNPGAPQKTFLYGLANAVTSYWKYLGRTLYPNDLILQYENPSSGSGLLAASVSLAALAFASVIAFRLRKKAPEITFGWFWFLLILFPNSGIVPAGLQSFADRYTYLPHIGIAVALTWGAARLAGRMRLSKAWLVLPGAVVVTVLALQSAAFTGYWKNSYTLFGHIDDVDEGKNMLALSYLAVASMDDKDPVLALHYLDKLMKCDHQAIAAVLNRGIVLSRLGRYDEALGFLRQQLKSNPQNPEIIAVMSEIMKEMAAKQNR